MITEAPKCNKCGVDLDRDEETGTWICFNPKCIDSPDYYDPTEEWDNEEDIPEDDDDFYEPNYD